MNLFNFTFPILGLISGGIFYILLNDFYAINILKKKRYITPLNLKTIINPGLLIGGIIGYLRVYLGMPIIYYFFNGN